MKTSLLPMLQSPDGGGSLTLRRFESDGDEILGGELEDECGRVYPIVDGIPRLLSGALLLEQKSEMAARDAQVGDYDKMPFLNMLSRVEIPMTARALCAQNHETILEAGCGTGRMTNTLAQSVETLVSIDFSFESLRANRKKLVAAGISNVHLVQADLCHLPFADDVFSRIVSCQVLEHVPTAESRQSAIKELARAGQPGCSLVLSAYKHSVFTKLFGSKQGAHDGGIPYFRFTKPELREVLETSFSVNEITGKLMYIYLAECRAHDGAAEDTVSEAAASP